METRKNQPAGKTLDEESNTAKILGNILLIGSFFGVGLGLIGVLGAFESHDLHLYGAEGWWSKPLFGMHFFGGLGVLVLILVPVFALLVLGWMSVAKKNWSNLWSIAGLLLVMVIALVSGFLA